MANTAVQGTVVGADGAGIAALKVVAYDIEEFTRPVVLGHTTTAAGSGFYKITYGSFAYGAERKPDLQVRVFDAVERLLHASVVVPDVGVDTYDMPPLQIYDSDRTGLFVTLLKGHGPTMIEGGNLVAFDVDNEAAFRRVTEMIAGATTSVDSTQLLLQTPELFTIFNVVVAEGQPLGAGDAVDIVHELVEASRRGLSVRLALNRMMGDVTSAEPVRDHFAEEAAANAPHAVKVGVVDVPFTAAMHAKLFVFDRAEAYINASPLLQEYYDGNTHRYADLRRGKWSPTKFGQETSVIRMPIHDVSVSIRGPAVSHLYETFRTIWETAAATVNMNDPAPPALDPMPAPAPTSDFKPARVQVVRTMPGGVYSAPVDGERGILEAYLRAIEAANDFIYIENQYLTEKAITSALLAALTRRAQLQLIVLVNVRVDAPLYRFYQSERIRELFTGESAIDARIGIFTIWSEEHVNNESSLIPIYVHSKLSIIDDIWATVGSANLDGQGLIFSQHVSPVSGDPSTSILEYPDWERRLRATEVNVTITSDTAVPTVSDAVVDVRHRVWAEHLGLGGIPAARPNGGWLSLWSERSDAKLAHLAGASAGSVGPDEARQIRIIRATHPFAVNGPFEAFLEAQGLSKEQIEQAGLRYEVPAFDFATGTVIEPVED